MVQGCFTNIYCNNSQACRQTEDEGSKGALCWSVREIIAPTSHFTHSAVLLRNKPPVTVTTVDSPQAKSAPPSSSAELLPNSPPSIVTLEPPKSKLFPEQ